MNWDDDQSHLHHAMAHASCFVLSLLRYLATASIPESSSLVLFLTLSGPFENRPMYRSIDAVN